jgi:hypothetical protein
MLLSQFHHLALLHTAPMYPRKKKMQITLKKTILPTEQISNVKQFVDQVMEE